VSAPSCAVLKGVLQESCEARVGIRWRRNVAIPIRQELTSGLRLTPERRDGLPRKLEIWYTLMATLVILRSVLPYTDRASPSKR
jgi:hypothetical protein